MNHPSHKIIALLLLLLLLLPTLLADTSQAAQPKEAGRLAMEQDGNKATLHWDVPSNAASATLITFRELPVGASISVKQMTTRPSTVANVPLVQKSDVFDPSAVAAMAEQPVTVVRRATFRGAPLVVIGLSPFVTEKSGVQQVVSLEAEISGVAPLADTTTLANALAAPGGSFGQPVPPTNPLAFEPSVWTLTARSAGMQRVTGSALAAAGVNLSGLNPAALHVYFNGRELPLDVRGVGDGRIDPGDDLRFYIPAVGDRWNSATQLWLTMSTASPPLRMPVRTALPGSAPLRTTGVEVTRWEGTALYDSHVAGARGDHWFGAWLVTGPVLEPARATVVLTPTMLLAAGEMQTTLMGEVSTGSTHRLRVGAGGSVVDIPWSGTTRWAHSTSLSVAASISMTLLPGAAVDGVLLQSVVVTRPVQLDMQNRTTAFGTLGGVARHQLQRAPSLRALYDVTDPARPQLVIIPSGESPQFEDGSIARQYLLAEPTTLPQPLVSAHAPITLPTGGQGVIIAPRAFLDALRPLVTHRQAQGISIAMVAAEDLYAAWSYGAMNPESIRSFLRHAAATWPSAPASVLLVGDGSYDPRNYSGLGRPTFIPPYLAPVDLWLVETACETCFVQLDGDDPSVDSLPDLMLGRLPAKSVLEVQQAVTKIIEYEATPWGVWKQTVGSVADNYRNADGSLATAIDFPSLATASEQHYAEGVKLQRMYYDPYPGTSTGIPWREPDAARALARTRNVMSAGAAVVQYAGHSHHYQWGLTDANVPPGYLLGLNDIGQLQNGRRLPVMLELTCLTSSFHQASPRGTTIDEAMVLSPTGGAIGTWGSSGLGVAHGHDHLQEGFVEALGAPGPPLKQLGALTLAGYLQLFTQGECCQDALRTFLLLGDPLTRVQFQSGHQIYVPLVRR